jgi:hypothetical protein
MSRSFLTANLFFPRDKKDRLEKDAVYNNYQTYRQELFYNFLHINKIRDHKER